MGPGGGPRGRGDSGGVLLVFLGPGKRYKPRDLTKLLGRKSKKAGSVHPLKDKRRRRREGRFASLTRVHYTGKVPDIRCY